MNRVVAISLLGLLLPTAGYAWVPVDCGDRISELNSLSPEGSPAIGAAWQAHAREVRSARPGSALYVPRPYPATEAEVLEDFAYAFRTLITDREESAPRPPEEQVILEGLAAGSLRFEVLRVDNWMLSRCSLHRIKPLYFVVRVFGGRRELGRAALLASGLWARFRTYPEGSAQPLPHLHEVAARLQKDLGSEPLVQTPQWVALDGLPGCGPLDPCVAVATASRIAVASGDGSRFEIAMDRPWLSVSDWRRQARTQLQPLAPGDEPLVSVGFAWGRARRIVASPR